MRYERLKDIGLTEQQIKDNLMFGTDKIGSTMTVAMTPAEAKQLVRHGAARPVGRGARARQRLALQLLPGVLRDDQSATGWNNLVFPNVGMPHVLWALSGPSKLVETEFDSHEKARRRDDRAQGARAARTRDGRQMARARRSRPIPTRRAASRRSQYQAFVADLVNFMDYVAEPTKNKRISLGIVVLLYLGVLFVLVYALKRSYWKDVH